MSVTDRLKARMGSNIAESMGAASTGAGGPLPGVARGVASRYDGVTRPREAMVLPVEKIRPDPDQPRKEFDEDDLRMLAESLKARGQLQAIRVRWDEGRAEWLIVSGERRWRAACQAGLGTLMAIEAKGEPDPDDLLEDQLVENCVRADLRPIEQAHAFKALMERRGYSGRQLAEKLAISHTNVQRALTLLELPESIQERVEQGALAPTTAVEIAKLPEADREAVAQAAVEGGLRRAEVGELVSAIRAKRPAPAARREPVTIDLGDGTVVRVSWRKANGTDATRALKLALKRLQDVARGDTEAA
jgi:ParB family chromosome partitioning protein